MIEGVTFDWWNTIAVTTEDQDRRLRDLRVDRVLAAARGRAGTREALLRAYDRHTAFLQDQWRRNADLAPGAQIDGFLGFAGLDPPGPAIRAAVSEAFGGALLELPPALFPHIAETLETLSREGVAVGLVSNTGRTWGRYLRTVQDRLGIGRYFDARVFSDEVGVRKPEAAIFRTALENLGLPADRVVHVGDDVDADVAGASALGIRAVWFNTGRWPGASTDRAAAEIADHGDLPGILKGWRR